MTRPYYLQRLTERTYFFGGGFYTTTFYVGDKGVLVFDPPEGQGEHLAAGDRRGHELARDGDRVLARPRRPHDRRAGASRGGERGGGQDVRIIASTETVDEDEARRSARMPAPTETVAWPKGTFEFEGLTVELHGFVRAAHADDAAALLLVQEKVAHLPDLVNGDQPPFRHFAESENYIYYRPNVNELGALDWIHLVGGHGNVGSKDDIRFYNTFLDDLAALVANAMATVKFAEGGTHEVQQSRRADDALAHRDHHGGDDELRPQYGSFYGVERQHPANAEMVALSMVSYR